MTFRNAETADYKNMTVAELSKRLAAGEPVYLLDVRQPAEHALAVIPGSTLIPLNELLQRVNEVQPPPGAAIVVYCHHGVRSQHGAHYLAVTGLQNVYSLMGGIEAWSLEHPEVPRY